MTALDHPTSVSAHYVHGKHFTDTTQVRAKVEQDIAFLTDRIGSMKHQARPNTVVIETYETMLNSRIAVLEWLQQGSREPQDEVASQRA